MSPKLHMQVLKGFQMTLGSIQKAHPDFQVEDAEYEEHLAHFLKRMKQWPLKIEITCMYEDFDNPDPDDEIYIALPTQFYYNIHCWNASMQVQFPPLDPAQHKIIQQIAQFLCGDSDPNYGMFIVYHMV